MTQQQEQPKETRTRTPRQFGRMYDYEKGAAVVNSAFDKEFNLTVELGKIPENVLRGFALQSALDYIVGEANEALKEEKEGESEDERRARALGVAQEAYNELVEGKVDFRAGAGLGGMRSAIGALGTVLFELGKKALLNQRGERLPFTDLHGARAAAKALYLDTTPKGPFEEVKDDKGQVVKNEDGSPKLKGLAKDSWLTGRMIFNAICETPEIAEKLAAMRPAPKPKEKPQGDNFLA